MFGRAGLQRTVVLVVALLLTAGSMDAFAREFRAADTRNEDYPTVQALRFMGRQISERTKYLPREARRSGRFMRQKWRDLELQSRNQAAGVVIVSDIDSKPFEAATIGIYARAQRDPASAQPIERIRKVE